MNIFIRLNSIVEQKITNRVSTSHKKGEKKREKLAQDERAREGRTIMSMYCILMKSILITSCSQYSINHTLSIFYTCKQLFRTTALFQCL